MLALVFAALLTGASAECIHDNRVQSITTAELKAREEIQGFSKEGMWKMPKLAQHADEETLEDCGSCTDAEVQVELMQAQMGESPLLNEIDGIFYPVENVYAPNGFKLSYKDIPHEPPKKVKELLEHRVGSMEIPISGYRQLTETDAERLAKDHEQVTHVAPQGLGPFFQEARAGALKKEKASLMVKSAQKSLAEYATHVRVLRDIEKSSTKGSGVYLVLKEGFIMSPEFKARYKKVLSEAPKDWDILFLHTGPNKNNPVRCEDRIGGSSIFEMRRPVTTPDGEEKFYKSIDAYIVRKQSIGKILKLVHNSKAAPLNELLMSVHSEEKVRRKDGKTDYNVEGIYSYVVNDNMLNTVPVARPTVASPFQVKDKTPEGAEKKEDKKEAKKNKKSLLQTV